MGRERAICAPLMASYRWSGEANVSPDSLPASAFPSPHRSLRNSEIQIVRADT